MIKPMPRITAEAIFDKFRIRAFWNYILLPARSTTIMPTASLPGVAWCPELSKFEI
jgi:hypothetical protein